MTRIAAFALVGLALSSGSAAALTMTCHADLKALGPTDAAGAATLVHDVTARRLSVSILAGGLDDAGDAGDADIAPVHLAHIHGAFDDAGAPTATMQPTIADDDADGDGFVELAEGFPKYGPIILGLTDESGGFRDSVSGVLDYSATYDLSDESIFGDGFSEEDLLPLGFREIVIHGGRVTAGQGVGTDGQVDGTAGFKTLLPVLAGQIRLVEDANAVVPLPAAAWLLLGGIGAIGAAGARRRRA